MKSFKLNATLREDVRSRSALKALRSKGRVPAILYGGKENINFHVDAITLEKLISTVEVHLVDIKIGDKVTKSVTREIQFHPVTDEVIHIDFMEVLPGKPIEITVPVKFVGNPIGVMNGGQKREKLRGLDIKSIPENIPNEFVIDVTHLKIGDVIQVEDIKDDNIEFLNHPKDVVVAIRASRVVTSSIVDEDEDEDIEGEETDAEGAEKEETSEATE